MGSEHRNVGTPMNPVSYLHQRAVALLYDELTRPEVNEPVVCVRLTPGGEWSHNLREGVKSVKVPGEWDAVGGIIPDLILYGAEGSKPLRIIEVVTTNPPDAAKREKLDVLERRGVGVVLVTVKKESDLLDLCKRTTELRFSSLTRKDRVRNAYAANQKAAMEQQVEQLISAIVNCSPAMRRRLVQVLSELETLESLYPIRSGNPLKDLLEE